MSRGQQRPVREAREDNEWQETHPAYGMLGFSRVHGSGTVLHGSALEHNNFISLVISTGRKTRTIGGDHYYDDKELIDVWMTESQFAHAISSFNNGSGTPCTLVNVRRLTADGQPGVMHAYPAIEGLTSAESEHNAEFEAEMTALVTDLRTLEHEVACALDARTVKKSVLKTLQAGLRRTASSIEGSVPFIHQRFQAYMEDTRETTKAEIEAYWRASAERVGKHVLKTGKLPPGLLTPGKQEEKPDGQ